MKESSVQSLHFPVVVITLVLALTTFRHVNARPGRGATAAGRALVVDQRHSRADDRNPGTQKRPFRTVNAAAQQAQPGDTVLVLPGVYRERVSPARGGTAAAPIVYRASQPGAVFLRGSEEFHPQWVPQPEYPGVYAGSLRPVTFGTAAYHGYCDTSIHGLFNPYLRNFNRNMVVRPHSETVAEMQRRIEEAEKRRLEAAATGSDTTAGQRGRQRRRRMNELEMQRIADPNDPFLRTTLGQVFLDGVPLLEVERRSELYALTGTWMASPQGDSILIHLPEGSDHPSRRLVEISVRHTVFAPLNRGLGHIHVNGFVIEHGANQSPTWWPTGWPQSGLLSTRTGHHWVIENNLVRYAKSVGIDCGSEHIDSENIENAFQMPDAARRMLNAYQEGEAIPDSFPGRHVIRNNRITDNGHVGLTGIGHFRTQIVGNIIERNNRTGYTSPWWEFGGIKFHLFIEGVIEGNLVRDNDCHGIWIDNQWKNSRITRNVIINNLWSGINMELGRGPFLIDNNVIAYTRQGDGIYGHDIADITIAHNLIYGNANFGVWTAYATPRVKPEDGCWDIQTVNNLILGNRAGAIAYPLPWECAGNNRSDANLLMGAGCYLDEGSGPAMPLFQITNRTHGGHSAPVKVPMTRENALKLFIEHLDMAGVPPERRPNYDQWSEDRLVNLDIWRAATGNDTTSRVMSVIRDGLQSRLVSWECEIDPVILQVRPVPVEGVDRDFLGNPFKSEGALPGPFQNLEPGIKNRLLLWPVRGIGSSWILE